LRFFDNCPKYINGALNNATVNFDGTQYLANVAPSVLSTIFSRMGFTCNNWTVTTDQVNSIYKLCAFDISVYDTENLFCALFDKVAAEKMEYYNDIVAYWQNGYGVPISYQSSCVLFQDAVAVLDQVVQGKTTQKAYMRFAHAETLMPFLAILGLFNDSYPLRYNSSDAEIQNRQWRTSQISCYTANIAMLLYSCPATSSPFRVKLLHNEAEYQVPGCSDMYCPYTEFKSLYSAALNYNFQTMCN